MQDPNYLLHVSEGAEEIAEQLHGEIIKRIVNRIMLRIGRGDDYILTAQDKWQLETLQQAGYLLEDIQKEIAKATKLQQTEIAEAMEEAGVKALEYDDEVYRSAGLNPAPFTQSPELIRIAQRNYEATMGEFRNFTRTMAQQSQQLFISECDRAYNLVSTGAMSYSEAVKEVINNVVKDGVKVKYPSGREDTIETATLRAVRTGISQMSAQITDARMEEMNWDIVLVSSHLGARVTEKEDYTNHYWWQGKFYSRSGKDKRFQPFSVCGFGKIQGVCGANCRHSIGPGDGEHNPFKEYDSEENRKQYEKEQHQRTLERRIRDTKREVMGLKESVDSCADKKAKFELDLQYQKKAALLAKQNKAYKEFCEVNNLRTRADRIQIAKWDRQQAAAARGAAKRYENSTLSDSTDKWARESKAELFKSEKSLATRTKEVAEVYSADGKYLFTKRGTVNEISFSPSEFMRLRGTVITHNHPSGGSFSSQDIRLLQKSKAAELRVITENGVYFLKQPKTWSLEINNLEKIKAVRSDIMKEVAKKYQKLYNQGKITKVERFQMTSDEVNRIFAERYGIEYGKEVFKD